MTPAAWLASRRPVPPPALAGRLIEALGAEAHVPPADMSDVLLAASEGLLRRLLTAGRTDRQTALDLLTADAFVTYAFEAASDDAARITSRAQRAMTRISQLAVEAHAQPGVVA